MKILFIVFGMLLLPHLASAGYAGKTVAVLSGPSTMLAAQRLDDATPANRTATVVVDKKYSKIRYGVQFTWSSALTVTIAPTCSYDGGSTYYSMTTKACALGVCTLYARSDVRNVTASEDFEAEYGTRGCTHMQFLTGGTNLAAGDIVTTQAVVVVGT